MVKFSVNTFTNPNEERVSQAFCGGMPITREFPVGDPAPYCAAQEAFDKHYGKAEFYRWNAEDGETLISSKRS